MINALFVFIISLLLIHEMDAIRAKEWRMFIVLKDMPEETAYKVFSAAHLPLYFASIFALIQENTAILLIVLYLAIDLFLIGHTAIHFIFRKHENNGFTSFYSKAIIYFMGFLSILHLLLYLKSNKI